MMAASKPRVNIQSRLAPLSMLQSSLAYPLIMLLPHLNCQIIGSRVTPEIPRTPHFTSFRLHAIVSQSMPHFRRKQQPNNSIQSLQIRHYNLPTLETTTKKYFTIEIRSISQWYIMARHSHAQMQVTTPNIRQAVDDSRDDSNKHKMGTKRGMQKAENNISTHQISALSNI